MKYTKRFAIAGLALPLFVIFDNTPTSPFHDAVPLLRLIGGGILAGLGAGIGAVVGLLIDFLMKKK
jgi:hypothetical protein